MVKAIETIYKGRRFRSRLEARWAVFFDACGADWEYEPEGFEFDDGTKYLPDFILHNVDGRGGPDVYIEVKGKMTDADERKIEKLYVSGLVDEWGKSRTPVYVVGPIPNAESLSEIIAAATANGDATFYNFATVDGDLFTAHIGVNKNGRMELFGDDCNYLCDMDEDKTWNAYLAATTARFEHGETPLAKGALHGN